MQKESLLFFLFPSDSIFGEAQDTKKRVKYKRKACFSFYFRAAVFSVKPKILKSE